MIVVRAETHFGQIRLYPASEEVADLVLRLSRRQTLRDPASDGPTSEWLELFKLLGVEVVVEGEGGG